MRGHSDIREKKEEKKSDVILFISATWLNKIWKANIACHVTYFFLESLLFTKIMNMIKILLVTDG